MPVNETHDPNLKSWVESANDPRSDFPIQNLPFVAFTSLRETPSMPVVGVIIGAFVLDLFALAVEGLLDSALPHDDPDSQRLRATMPFDHGTMGSLMELAPTDLRAVRARLVDLLRSDNPTHRQNRSLQDALIPMDHAVFHKPMSHHGSYTDFYASKHHALTVGSMFRPDNPLLPNYKHVPIAYHGRASSVVPSGTDIRRPLGQTKADDAQDPAFGPCKMLDYEMELGLFIGRGNNLGEPIPINQAHDHIFGMCIVNDWSARDLQKWEYQPLGPFLAKNFATTISPFVVTMEALEPFRIPGPERDPDDPQPLPYLRATENWGLDISVEVHLASKQMRDKGLSPVRLSKGNFKHMYWTIAQMVAHHASNGCNLQPGDLLASGTISGPTKDSRGCLLELTWDGLDPATGKPKPRVPVQLPTGETRTFLADGDEVIMKAYCEKPGFRRIGFGECRGTILPAKG